MFRKILIGFLLLLVVLAGLTLLTHNYFRGEKLYRISSASMLPTLPVGTIVAIKPMTSYLVGDIITLALVNKDNNATTVVTHRIFSISTQDGRTVFQTKGDNNNAPDIAPIYLDNIQGKVIHQLTFIGTFLTFLHTPLGINVLIVIPVTILIYEQLRYLGPGLKKHYRKVHYRKKHYRKKRP